jgi:hypothetical protein
MNMKNIVFSPTENKKRWKRTHHKSMNKTCFGRRAGDGFSLTPRSQIFWVVCATGQFSDNKRTSQFSSENFFSIHYQFRDTTEMGGS